MAAPSVFVVDDDVSVRESLRALIPSAGWRVETFASAPEFLARPPADGACCLVLDVSLPGPSGLDLQRQLAQQRSGDRPELPIVFVTGHGDIPMMVRAMKGGAVEFLTKPFDVDVLLAAIGQALERSRASLVGKAARRRLDEDYASLSPREREVMTCVVAGRLNKQIATDLGISEITVKAHRGRVMRKMHAASLADLVRMADRLSVGRPG